MRCSGERIEPHVSLAYNKRQGTLLVDLLLAIGLGKFRTTKSCVSFREYTARIRNPVLLSSFSNDRKIRIDLCNNNKRRAVRRGHLPHGSSCQGHGSAG